MEHILWNTSPAANWHHGDPLGNGRLGAWVLGGCEKETVYLNEDTLWSGFAGDYTGPRPIKALATARRLLAENRFAEADEIINREMLEFYTESYMPMGWLAVEMEGLGEISGYRRELDIAASLHRTRFTAGGAEIVRTVF